MRVHRTERQPAWTAALIFGMFTVAIALDLGGWSRSARRVEVPEPAGFAVPLASVEVGRPLSADRLPPASGSVGARDLAAGISREENVVSADVAGAAEEVLMRYADGRWTVVLADYLGLGSERWGAIFRANDESEVVLALARSTGQGPSSTTVTEVRIDVESYAGELMRAGASP